MAKSWKRDQRTAFTEAVLITDTTTTFPESKQLQECAPTTSPVPERACRIFPFC